MRTPNRPRPTRLYADRVDDRGCDHRYLGGHRHSAVSGLCNPVTLVGQLQRGWSLKAAIAECSQANNNVISGTCDTLTLLNTGQFWPTMTAPVTRYTATSMITATTGAIVIDGSANGQLGNCIVTLTPTLVTGNIQWVPTNSGPPVCARSKTGIS